MYVEFITVHEMLHMLTSLWVSSSATSHFQTEDRRHMYEDEYLRLVNEWNVESLNTHTCPWHDLEKLIKTSFVKLKVHCHILKVGHSNLQLHSEPFSQRTLYLPIYAWVSK
jgi:hypothetical protein